MNYLKSPIIIKGVNHSGTGVLVEILKILGSDAGDINNKWKENKFFLEIHKSLISKISKNSWTKTIFDTNFYKKNGYVDNMEYLDLINKKILDLKRHYSDPKNKAWHWKCPSSVFFDKTWEEVFPDAHTIIIQRDPYNVARSLLKNQLFKNYDDALIFHKVMSEKILSSKNKNVLKVKYNNLENEIDKIAEFIPFRTTPKKINLAKTLVEKENLIRLNRDFSYNIKNIYAELKIKYFKLKKKFQPN